jgi:hypothetical protein
MSSEPGPPKASLDATQEHSVTPRSGAGGVENGAEPVDMPDPPATNEAAERGRIRRMAAWSKATAVKAADRAERERESHLSVDVGFRAAERQRRVAAMVLAGGIAYRIFFWLLAGAALVAAGFQAMHVFTVYFLGPKLESATQLYGVVGVVTTALFCFYLGGRLIVAGATLDVEFAELRARKRTAAEE